MKVLWNITFRPNRDGRFLPFYIRFRRKINETGLNQGLIQKYRKLY